MYTIICLVRILFYKNPFIISTFSFPSTLIVLEGVIWPLINGQKEIIWQCKQHSLNGRLTADCSGQNKGIDVPTNLDANIEVLNLSGNKLYHLTDQSFEKYKDNLIVLDLSHSFTTSRKFDPKAFSILNRLLYLNLSSTCLPERGETIAYQAFPETVIEFKHTSCKLDSVSGINLSSMESLETLDAKGNKFSKFPIFSVSSPSIKYVDLSYNPLDEVQGNAMDIAPYCNLQQLIVQMDWLKPGLQGEAKHCDCMKILKWLQYAEVKYNLTCQPPSVPLKDCAIDAIDPLAVEARNKCLQMRQKFGWLLILIVLASLMLVLVAILFLVRKFKSKKENPETAESGGDVEEHESEIEEELETS